MRRHTAILLVLPLLSTAVRLAAQEMASKPQTAEPPPVTTSGSPPPIGLTIQSLTSDRSKTWGVDATFNGASDRIGRDIYGNPKWSAGFRARREFFGRVDVAAGATFTRGEQMAASFSRELGTGRDLSVDSPLTGPGTYRTVFDTTLSASVAVKQSGHLRIDGIGELWNPFNTDAAKLVPSDPQTLRTPTFKFGILTRF